MKTLFPEIRRFFDLTDDEMHGYSEESIQAVEESLGTRLPTVLRQFYLEIGAHSMNSLQDRVVSLFELDEQDDADWIVFYAENQGVVLWAVKRDDCGLDDPPVYAQLDADPWTLETESVSLFLQTMLHHQAAMGYYPHNALASSIDVCNVECLKKHFKPSDERFNVWLQLQIYAGSSESSIELWLSDSSTSKFASVQHDLSIASKTKEGFLALYAPFREQEIRWDIKPDWVE